MQAGATLTAEQRSMAEAALDGLGSEDAAEVSRARTTLIDISDAKGMTEPARIELTKVVGDKLSELAQRGSPMQSINAVSVAAALRTADGATICVRAMASGDESRTGVRVAAATVLEHRISSFQISDTQAASLARAVAQAGASETEGLIVADQLSILTKLLSPTDKDPRRNTEVLKAMDTLLANVAATLGKDSQSPELAGGVLLGLRQLRASVARSPSAFLALAGQTTGRSLSALEKSAALAKGRAAKAAGDRSLGASERAAAEAQARACNDLGELCTNLRDKLFKPAGAGGSGAGGRSR